MMMISKLPSVMLVTVNVSASTVWPASMVSMVTPLNSPALAPPSVKVGLTAVAVKVVASLTVLTVTVEAIDRTVVSTPPSAVPPLSWMLVKVATRSDVPGSSLVFLYAMPSTNVWALPTEVPVVVKVTVAVDPDRLTL